MVFTAQYGYVGFAVEQQEFVAEGLNEAGLSAGLFYFPNYGEYAVYDPASKSSSVADLQLVPLVLSTCRDVGEVEKLIDRIRVINIDPRGLDGSLAFRRSFGASGRAGVYRREACFYENKLGVLTNSPGFDWQLTNLNNYVNLHAGSGSGS